MAIVHPSQIERSISRLNETAYGTARLSGDSYRRIISDSASLSSLTTEFEDDAGYDNGSDMPSEKWATTVDSTVNFTPKFNFQDIGYFLKDFLGTYAAPGGSGPYIHTFTPQDMNVSRQMPSRTYLEKLGGLFTRMIPSIVGTQLTISGGKMGRIDVSAQYTGTGAYTKNPAGYTSPAVTSDREYGYGGQAFFRFYDNDDGVNQVETATVAGTVSGAGNASVTVTAAGLAGSPIVLAVPVANLDSNVIVASKIRVALQNHLVISNFFDVTQASASIIFTKRVREATDATLNVAIATGTATGITAAPTSTDTTTGVAGDAQSYTCDLETWTLTFENPPVEPGYRQCSPYVVAGNPRSGVTRSEFYVGARRIRFAFTARLNTNDKMRDWMQAGTDVTLEIPIVGEDANNASLRMVHTKAIIDSSEEVSDVGGFIGINGSLDLMSVNGVIPFTATLQNDVPSYSS